MDECVGRMASRGAIAQNPVAHLVCNFAAPTRTSTPSLLNHDEVLTLFHEFGHTLHHVLTRVDYPSVSGINGVPWDAVELPSQFMENFAWAAGSACRMISGHYRTGQALPDELLERLRRPRACSTRACRWCASSSSRCSTCDCTPSYDPTPRQPHGSYP